MGVIPYHASFTVFFLDQIPPYTNIRVTSSLTHKNALRVAKALLLGRWASH